MRPKLFPVMEMHTLFFFSLSSEDDTANKGAEAQSSFSNQPEPSNDLGDGSSLWTTVMSIQNPFFQLLMYSH